MNPGKFLESAFVTSQIELNKKQSTWGHGENHAILAWMWVVLKLLTVYHFFKLGLKFLLITLRLKPALRPALEIATDERMKAAEAMKAAQELAANGVSNVTAIK